jgi:hypothetical protein
MGENDEIFIPNENLDITFYNEGGRRLISFKSNQTTLITFIESPGLKPDALRKWYEGVVSNRSNCDEEKSKYENYINETNELYKSYKIYSYPVNLSYLSFEDFMIEQVDNLMIGRHLEDGSLILRYSKNWKDPAKILRISYNDIIDFEITGEVEKTYHQGDMTRIQGEWKGTRLAAGFLLAGPVGAALIGKTKDQYVGHQAYITEEDKRRINININPNANIESLHTGPVGVSIDEGAINLPYSFLEIVRTLYPEKQQKLGNGGYEQL